MGLELGEILINIYIHVYNTCNGPITYVLVYMNMGGGCKLEDCGCVVGRQILQLSSLTFLKSVKLHPFAIQLYLRYYLNSSRTANPAVDLRRTELVLSVVRKRLRLDYQVIVGIMTP